MGFVLVLPVSQAILILTVLLCAPHLCLRLHSLTPSPPSPLQFFLRRHGAPPHLPSFLTHLHTHSHVISIASAQGGVARPDASIAVAVKRRLPEAADGKPSDIVASLSAARDDRCAAFVRVGVCARLVLTVAWKVAVVGR